MMTSISSEFRKFLTVRSTYFIILFCLLLIGLFAFYGQGLRYGEGLPKNMPVPPVPPDYLQHAVRDATNALALFVALIGALQMTHEYRYGTIMYTLTTSNSRTKTIVSKIIVTSVVAVALTLIFGFLSPVATAIGLHINGAKIGTQVFYYKELLWQIALYGWGFAMVGLLLAVFIRNQIGTIVALLLYPLLVEPLVGQILGESKSLYLPFMALGTVVNHNPTMPATRGAVIFLSYLAVGWIVGWILFVRRDAN